MTEPPVNLQGVPPAAETDADAFADELAEILYSHDAALRFRVSAHRIAFSIRSKRRPALIGSPCGCNSFTRNRVSYGERFYEQVTVEARDGLSSADAGRRAPALLSMARGSGRRQCASETGPVYCLCSASRSISGQSFLKNSARINFSIPPSSQKSG